MRIRTTFILTMILFGLVLIIMSASLIITNQRVDRLNEQEEVAMNIERGVSELGYLGNDYLLYHEEQQHTRWDAKWSAIHRDLAQLKAGSAEQQAIIHNINANHKRLKVVFDNVT